MKRLLFVGQLLLFFFFSSAQSISITSPDGGEIFYPCETHTITWTQSGSSSVFFNIDYSLNNGLTWASVASNYFSSNGQFTWTIPNFESTVALVRVIDTNTPTIFDISDDVFEIRKTIDISSPNGGEVWLAGNTYPITWSNEGTSNYFNLEYSDDNGSSWNTIVNNHYSTTGTYDWQTPNIGTSNYLVRISDYTDNCKVDVSNATFTIDAETPLLTYPNGGEIFFPSCDYTITWNQNTFYGDVTLSYSIDNGSSWTWIGTNIANTGSFDWTNVPEIATNAGLIRIRETDNSDNFDTSDATFSIETEAIIVTSPNNGEDFNVGETIELTWDSNALVSGTYNITYTTDNPITQTYTLITNYTGNSYTWNIPSNATISGKYLFTIEDSNNTCINDVTDSYVNIGEVPTVFSPNGGEIFKAFCTNVNDNIISWNPGGFRGSVKIEYSINNGQSWSSVIISTNNDGNYAWTNIPSTLIGEMGLIKVSSNHNDYPHRYDISDAPFIIGDPITILQPNGGEQLLSCDEMLVTWTKPEDCFNNFYVYYSTDNGVSWTYINYSSTPDNSEPIQSFNWQLPDDINSENMLVRVHGTNGPGSSDVSDATFSLEPNNDITVTYPSAGQSFAMGETVTITWDNTQNVSGQYTVQYKKAPAYSNWTTIAGNVSGNLKNWTVPNDPGQYYTVQVFDRNDPCRLDISNYFTVEEPLPVMTSPNGGESFYAGVDAFVQWDMNTFDDFVKLDYSIDGGMNWIPIASLAINNGSYPWEIPNNSSSNCLVRVSEYDDSTRYDISDASFTIKPAITILVPNGGTGAGSTLGGCTVTSIAIDRSPAYNQFRVEYSIDNGNNWIMVTNTWVPSGNPVAYNWDIPNVSSDQCLVRVFPIGLVSYHDKSDDTFTIEKAINVIQPSQGGFVESGSTYDITWASNGSSNVYNLYYSTDNGTTWNDIAIGYDTSGDSYSWLVPNVTSSNCLVRVEDNLDNCKLDESDQIFTINNTVAPITLLTPNGGENLQGGCSVYLIDWSESSNWGSYDISYSTDLGLNWINIVTNYTTGSSNYNWEIPHINEGEVLLRIKASGTSYIDVSDQDFAINSATELTASPASTIIEVGDFVQLTAEGGFGNYSWSPSIGLSDANIANPIASPTETTLYTVTSAGPCTYEATVLVEVSGSNLFVDHTATGMNDGSSWTNAFTDLQSAIAIGEGNNIHIAEGTYKPTTGTSRGATFDLKSDMTLLGGYPNGGGMRNSEMNETILSGNVDGVSSADGNSYHVVSIKNVNNVAIDGLTIRDGNANVESSFGRSRGGGVFVNGSTATFINTEIKWNRAIFGGGMFATLSPNVTFESCMIKNNTAGNGSALYHSNETNMYIQSSRIMDNNSTIRCAIEVNNSLYTRIENSIIANNASINANAIGFIATNRNQTCDVYSSTILGETKNKNLISLQIGNNDQLGVNFYNSIIAHQDVSFDKAFIAYNNNVLNLNTENCYIQGSTVIGNSTNNIYSVSAGDLLLNADYSLGDCSPAVDMGNNATATQFATDIDGNSRIVDVVDMGAFEAQTSCASSREVSNGVQEINIEESKVLVYPNPVNNILRIQTELEVLEIFVYDILGKRLKSTTSKEIDMSNLPQGIYHINIFSKGELVTTEKIAKR